MIRTRALPTLCLALGAAACAVPRPAPRAVSPRVDARPAVEALRRGEFAAAEREAAKIIAADAANPQARLVAAITRYKQAMHQLSTDVRTVIFGAFQAGGFNHRYMRSSLQQTEADLAAVEADLARAAVPGVSLEACLACWKVDWNHNGRIDEADERLFEIEQDTKGEPIPEGDPRRRPVFRFDEGDVAWARAFVAFQRAALDVMLAYEWTEVDRLLQMFMRRLGPITLRLARPELVKQARELILEGLDHADRARQAYLAETDDDREWLPNPRQQSHPMPLPVDAALYETWALVVGDLRRLVRGEEGLDVAAVAQLGDHLWEQPPRGYVDIGRMLAQPRDLALNLWELVHLDRAADAEGLLRSILGVCYVPRMKRSPLTDRLGRMKKEIDRGHESFERKLRYLLWIN